MQMYLVHWKALKTGASGHSLKGFPKAEASRYADALNKKDVGLLHHWIAPEEVDMTTKAVPAQ